MLASMLAQTPKTPPVIPTTVASSIMTQLPQERLPKNLEKKLLHTPFTTASVSGIATSSQAFQNLLAAPAVQKDIVTSDSRGHVLQASLVTSLSGVKVNYLQQIDKILGLEDETLVRQLDPNYATVSSSLQNSQNFAHQLTQSTAQNSSVSNTDLLNPAALVDADTSDTAQTNQASDPVFAEILEQVMFLFLC